MRQNERRSVKQQRAIERLKKAGLPMPDSFEAVAREWYAKQEPPSAGWSAAVSC